MKGRIARGRSPLRGLARTLVFTVLTFVVGTLVFGGGASATPTSAVDQTQVPHYFGPYPNWANSPLTYPDVTVSIVGDGTGATATATVGANGAITSIDLTNGGHGYGQAKVVFTSTTGSGAAADADIVRKGAVVGIDVNTPGAGYTAPTVTITPNGTGGGATATAFGGVDGVTVTKGGSGYTMPTVQFDMPDDPNGVQAEGHIASTAAPFNDPFDGMNADGSIKPNGVIVDNAGTGYSSAPGVSILNGTQFAPMELLPGGDYATAKATLKILSIGVDTPGSGYIKVPTVTITDPNGTGSGATATARLDNGVISAITLKKPGSGYVTAGGMKKFVDTLPGLGPTAANNLGNYVPVATPDTTTFSGADYYVIGLVQYRQRLSSNLPAAGSLMRGYVQVDWNATMTDTGGVPLVNVLPDGSTSPAMINGHQARGIDKPRFLGPVIVAQRNRAVRVVFYNLLPTGAGGDLYLPMDSTLMGAGEGNMAEGYDPTPDTTGSVTDTTRNPVCSFKNESANQSARGFMCFTDNRATLHLHGGNTPWISDGTPFQWITPAGESTQWAQGDSVRDVPDMVGASKPANVPDCSAANDGCQTFYWTNQQSARLMFYHDHAAGITRLNVYAGEAAGYVLTDQTEQKLFGPNGTYKDLGEGTPLVIQDRTFVPQDAQIKQQDPTWNANRWGGYGNLWWHHVYMPAQNPGDPSGMSSFGRWMYGPWFWPPAQDTKHGQIPNPYYNMDPKGPDGTLGTSDDFTTPLAKPCNLDDPSTRQYQSDPFCEPEFIPGTPNITVGAEQFNDTPTVNGAAYPTTSVDPKTYRFRILNAANDRFLNLQWYVADSTTASTATNALGQPIGGTEVALKPADIAAAQTDPNTFPTPDTTKSPQGPNFVQIGTEGGFLPAPVVIPNQSMTWITDPTRFDFGNVDKHALLLGPAERADVIVDFSKFAGKTLILYNDAPAAFPARVPCYDYYTGGPDLSPACAPSTLPGYGPNTRTIMQVKVNKNGVATAFNLTNLQNLFKHHADGSGVFESGQHPIVVGQAAYNAAYGTNFPASSWCNAPNSTIKSCDGFVRINDGEQLADPNNPDPAGWQKWKFNTLSTGTSSTLSIPLQPKAMHDEMNSSTFDEYGRMMTNLGLEARPPTPGLTNVNLMQYVWPTTEIFDASGLPAADVRVTPISRADDGTQIWKITHNGVDTHPIHFHAMDVQVINRVTWDNIVIPPDPNELGWKDTIRISPLEDTIVAMRPAIPHLPDSFAVNSVRRLNPVMPLFGGTDPLNPALNDTGVIASATLADQLGIGLPASNKDGEPIDIVNHAINFGAEYVYHCHILSHEEDDMMRPVSFAFKPKAADGLAYGSGTLTWNDNSLNETGFVVFKSTDGGTSWTQVGRVERNLTDPNTTGTASLSVAAASGDTFYVLAENTVGDTFDYSNPGTNQIPMYPGDTGFPTVTATSTSSVLTLP